MMRWFQKSKDDYPPLSPELQHPVKSKGSLLNPSEKIFYSVLSEILIDRYRLFAKVGLRNLLEVDSDLPEADQQALLQELSTHHLDFVIYDLEDSKIVGGVVLEEMAEDEVGRRLFDTFIDRSMTAAGLPVVHLPVNTNYSAHELKIEISRCIFLQWKTNPSERESSKPAPSKISDPALSVSPVPNVLGQCPKCGAPYLKRRAKTGKFAGQYFLACSNYPKCKNLRLIKASTRASA